MKVFLVFRFALTLPVFLCSNMSLASKFYELKPIKIGCQVFGIDLKSNISDEVRQSIIEDTRKHRILVFKNQGLISPERHLEIGRWFGKIESTFYDHPKSPLRDIFRVSNDESEGCTHVGRTGWHIDGSFQEMPFSHSLYHIVECPREGATIFAPLTEIIEGLSAEKRCWWDRLWMVSDRRQKLLHPLIYSHPETGKPVLCFHLGMTDSFIVDYGTPDERETDDSETAKILAQIHQEFVKEDLQYWHKWEPGDFIISDNLAVGHEASPQTQYPRSKVGLRVMHRVTIAGKTKPKK